MKRILWLGILIVILSGLTIGCGPAELPKTFAGAWTTNIGKASLAQKGDEIAGVIEGYGGQWNETFTGTLNEDGEAVFSTKWFGDFTLVLNGDTFKSKPNGVSFCGIRSNKSEELPDGCGFSGKWIVAPAGDFPAGSYLALNQKGQVVSGDLFDSGGKSLEAFTGMVYWGKGWAMNGTSSTRGEVGLHPNAEETGIEIVYGGQNERQLCAVREGQTSAYITYFTCQP